MSCRHPARNKSAGTKDAKTTKDTKDRTRLVPFVSFVPLVSLVFLFSVGNGRHLPRVERHQELTRAFQIEFRIGRLDAEEETVPAREREAWHVEHGVIRLRQPVE